MGPNGTVFNLTGRAIRHCARRTWPLARELQESQLHQAGECGFELTVIGVIALVLAHTMPAVLLHQVPVIVDDEVWPGLNPCILVEHSIDPLAQPVQRHDPADVHLASGRPDINVMTGCLETAHGVVRTGAQEIDVLVNMYQGLVDIEEDVHVV